MAAARAAETRAAILLQIAATEAALRLQAEQLEAEAARLTVLKAKLRAHANLSATAADSGARAEAHDASGAPAAADEDATSSCRPNRIPAAADRAFPALAGCLLAVPGFFHLGNQGLLCALWKLYFAMLISPLLARCWKNRSRVTKACNDFTRCAETWYHAQRVIWRGLIDQFESGRTVGKSTVECPQVYTKEFIFWLEQQWEVNDEVFRFYAGAVIGPGFIYRQVDNAIRVKDVHYASSLLLPLMGIFKLTGRHNLTRQSFFVLLRFMSAPERTTRAIMANLCVWESNRWMHAIATDKCLERRVGWVKRLLGPVCALQQLQPSLLMRSPHTPLGTCRLRSLALRSDSRGGQSSSSRPHLTSREGCEKC